MGLDGILGGRRGRASHYPLGGCVFLFEMRRVPLPHQLCGPGGRILGSEERRTEGTRTCARRIGAFVGSSRWDSGQHRGYPLTSGPLVSAAGDGRSGLSSLRPLPPVEMQRQGFRCSLREGGELEAAARPRGEFLALPSPRIFMGWKSDCIPPPVGLPGLTHIPAPCLVGGRC